MEAHEHRVLHSLATFRALPGSQRSSLAVVRGHCVLAIEDLVPHPKKYIAFLREPFQHFVSRFYYIRRAHWNPRHTEVKQLDGLMAFLEMQMENGLDNMQTRHLSGVLEAMVPLRPDDKIEMNVNEGLFDKAVKWLNALDHVGLTEQFDASLLMMKDGLAWPHHCYYQVQNRTKSRPDPFPDPILLERFKEVYKWDIALYALAKERFNQTLSAQGAGFAQRLSRFQSVNGMAQSLYWMKNRFAHLKK